MLSVFSHIFETNLSQEALDAASSSLHRSQCVIMPTETVYGVAVNALDPDALSNLIAYKHRPPEKPFPLMVRSLEAAEEYVVFPNENTKKFVKAFWPGPLTIVLPIRKDKQHYFYPSTISEDGYLGLRCPQHPVPLELLAKLPFPLAVPSANISGEKPPKTPQDLKIIVHNLQKSDKNYVSTVIVQNTETKGEPSTIVKVTQDSWTILRQGFISPEQIAHFLNP